MGVDGRKLFLFKGVLINGNGWYISENSGVRGDTLMGRRVNVFQRLSKAKLPNFQNHETDFHSHLETLY